MHVGRAVFTAAIITGLTFGGGGAAWAGPGGRTADTATTTTSALPAGWTLTKAASGFDLSWRPKTPIHSGNAAVRFYAGDRPLGQSAATADAAGTFHLAIDDLTARDLKRGLQVRAGERRIDVAADAVAPPRATATQPRAAAPLPENPVDPGVPGTFETTSGDYRLDTDLTLPGLPLPVPMTGHVVAPTKKYGARPVVLFLHGVHESCYQDMIPYPWGVVWPCPAGWNELPNYLGYVQIQQLLASQGYVTVSIDANAVNGQDGAAGATDDKAMQTRSSLVRSHLGHWADWATDAGRAGAPEVVRSAALPNMSKVMLVGHSRGGEGVNRAAVDSLNPPPPAREGYPGATRWQIRGLALIGPSHFSQNPAPDVPSMAILPACDGDISQLDGQIHADGTRGVGSGRALHSSVYVVGANHNFFNSQWTPGYSVTGAFDENHPADEYCGPKAPGRIAPNLQLQVGTTYVAAAAAVFLAGNDQVRPLLDGSGVRAGTAGPVTVLSHAVGGNRTALVMPNASTKVSGAGGQLCEVVDVDSTACSRTVPHFNRFDQFNPDAGRYGIWLGHATPGQPVTIRPATSVNLSGKTHVALRIAVNSRTPGTQFDITIVDAQNQRATLGTATLDSLSTFVAGADLWAQEVRLPLPNPAGVDLGHIAALEIITRNADASGGSMLLDAWGWQAGLPSPRPQALRRVDAGELTVQEGNAGSVTYQVPVTVSPSSTLSGKVRVFIADPVTETTTSKVVNVPVGSTEISVPITVTGDTIAGKDRTYKVGAKAVQNVAVGDAFGALIVRDDDA